MATLNECAVAAIDLTDEEFGALAVRADEIRGNNRISEQASWEQAAREFFLDARYSHLELIAQVEQQENVDLLSGASQQPRLFDDVNQLDQDPVGNPPEGETSLAQAFNADRPTRSDDFDAAEAQRAEQTAAVPTVAALREERINSLKRGPKQIVGDTQPDRVSDQDAEDVVRQRRTEEDAANAEARAVEEHAALAETAQKLLPPQVYETVKPKIKGIQEEILGISVGAVAFQVRGGSKNWSWRLPKGKWSTDTFSTKQVALEDAVIDQLRKGNGDALRGKTGTQGASLKKSSATEVSTGKQPGSTTRARKSNKLLRKPAGESDPKDTPEPAPVDEQSGDRGTTPEPAPVDEQSGDRGTTPEGDGRKSVQEAGSTGQEVTEQAGEGIEQSVELSREDKEILLDAGFTTIEVSRPPKTAPSQQQLAQAREGYAFVGGKFRAITQEDLDSAQEAVAAEIDRNTKHLDRAIAKHGEWTGKIANVFGSDFPPITFKDAKSYASRAPTSSIILANYKKQFARRPTPKPEPAARGSIVDDWNDLRVVPMEHDALSDEMKAEWREAHKRGDSDSDMAALAEEFIEDTALNELDKSNGAKLNGTQHAELRVAWSSHLEGLAVNGVSAPEVINSLEDIARVIVASAYMESPQVGAAKVYDNHMLYLTEEATRTYGAALLQQLNDHGNKQAAKKNGTHSRWFDMALQYKILGGLTFVPENLPAAFRKELTAIPPGSLTPAGMQAEKIAKLLTNIQEGSEDATQANIDRLAELWKTADLSFAMGTTETIRDYFSRKGTPNKAKITGTKGPAQKNAAAVDGPIKVEDVEPAAEVAANSTGKTFADIMADIKQEEGIANRAAAAKARKAANAKKAGQARKLDEANLESFKATLTTEQRKDANAKQDAENEIPSDLDGEPQFFRDDGSPITSLVPHAIVKMIVNRILNSFKARPRVWVYRDVADLKAKNPALFNEAVKARKKGDFETIANAVAWTLNDKMVIYSGRVRTQQQLEFVVAHEVLGHYGLAGILPRTERLSVLNTIYETNSMLRRLADQRIETGGESKLEAIEEVLSDYAAILDGNVILRVFNAIKTALNKLGIRFEDDLARYIVRQTGKFVKRGEMSTASAESFRQAMVRLAREQNELKFIAGGPQGNLAQTAFTMIARNHNVAQWAGVNGWKNAFANATLKAQAMGFQDGARGMWSSVLEEVQTLDNIANRSEGLSKVFRFFQKQANLTRALMAGYAELTTFSHSAHALGIGSGPTDEQTFRGGKILAFMALFKAAAVNDKALHDLPNLTTVDSVGGIVLNQAGLDAVAAQGEVTLAQFKAGLEVQVHDNTLRTPGKPNKDGSPGKVIEGGLVFKNTKTMPEFNFVQKLTEDSPEWKIVLEQRAAVNKAAADAILYKLKSITDQTNDMYQSIKDMPGATDNTHFSDDDIKILREIVDEYSKMYEDKRDVREKKVVYNSASTKRADRFLRSVMRALWQPDQLKAWQDSTIPATRFGKDGKPVTDKDGKAIPDDLVEFRDDPNGRFNSIIAGLTGLNNKGMSEETTTQIASNLRHMQILTTQAIDADAYAKHTIASAYVPFQRRGKFQVSMQAFHATKKGNPPVRLSEGDGGNVPYWQVMSKVEAQGLAAKADNIFGDQTYIIKDANGELQEVRFAARWSDTRNAPPLTELADYNEFISTLKQLNVNMSPQLHEKVVTAMASFGARSRNNLQRTNNAGWDENVVRNVSEHLEAQAHVIGKDLYRHKLLNVMDKDNEWLGDPKHLNDLKVLMDREAALVKRGLGNEEQLKHYTRDYNAYAHKYVHMAKAGFKNPDGTINQLSIPINGKDVKLKGRGEAARQHAMAVLNWYKDSGNILESTEDILSTSIGSKLKLWAVLFQLGGSAATAIVNMGSMITHSIPYLSTRNANTGFGGGHGLMRSGHAIFNGFMDTKDPRMATAKYLQELRDNNTDVGLSKDELDFLIEQTLEGTLQAAQFNALAGSARGGVGNTRALGIRGWMYMFSYTEQANRRATALASYRLEKERMIARGVDPKIFEPGATLTEKEAQLVRDVHNAARIAVNTSQGEYSMFNRPEMARGNFLQYVFMYKQFVIISIQLMKNLSPKERTLFIAALLLLSGVKGFPFADDVMDIIDTLLEFFGMKSVGTERWLAEQIDSLVPGASPYIMRGIFDSLGGTVSTRFGFGNNVPLTSVFLEGADPYREIVDFLGPVYAGMAGLFDTTKEIAQYALETVGIKDDTKDFNAILRNAPSSAVRGWADAWSFMDTGVIMNGQGRVVVKDPKWNEVVMRAIGFYPSRATEVNDVIRTRNFTIDYAKSIKARYVDAYSLAKIKGDRAGMQRIVGRVRDWNKGAKGTDFYIRTFTKDADKAAKERNRPASARFLKAQPKGSRARTAEDFRRMGIPIS